MNKSPLDATLSFATRLSLYSLKNPYARLFQLSKSYNNNIVPTLHVICAFAVNCFELRHGMNGIMKQQVVAEQGRFGLANPIFF